MWYLYPPFLTHDPPLQPYQLYQIKNNISCVCLLDRFSTGYEVITMSSCHIGDNVGTDKSFLSPVVVCLVVGSVTLTLCHYPIRSFLGFSRLSCCHDNYYKKGFLTLTYICRKFLMSKSHYYTRIENK